MAYVPKRLYLGQPGTSMTTLYTVNGKVIVRNIVLTNTASTDSRISIHFVPSGQSPDNSNKIVSDYAVQAGDTVVIDLRAVLETGDTIQAVQATAGAVTAYISGVEVQ